MELNQNPYRIDSGFRKSNNRSVSGGIKIGFDLPLLLKRANKEQGMEFSSHDGPGRAIRRLAETSIGVFLGVILVLAHPARAAAGDFSVEADTLPPSGTFIAVFVADSATGLPLGGASVTVQNPEANLGIAATDARGWAYIPSTGLPAGSTNRPFWITAGNPGYLSRLITLSGCGSDIPSPCALRYALDRATETNSFSFTGTLLDTARKPISRLPLDVSAASGGGWITFLSSTDENGHFVFTEIPKGLGNGYLFVRRSPSSFEMLTVRWSQSGDSITVPQWSATSLSPSRARLRAGTRKSAPLVLFRSQNRDAAGRRRD